MIQSFSPEWLVFFDFESLDFFALILIKIGDILKHFLVPEATGHSDESV